MILHKITKRNSKAVRFVLAAEGEDIRPLLTPSEKVESSEPVEQALGGRLSVTDAVRYPLGDEEAAVGFKEAVKRYEARLILRALDLAGRSVTRAAKLLGFSHYGSLQSLLARRHKDLQPARKPVVRRRRGIIGSKKGRKG